MACPASVTLSEGIEQTTSIYAEEGTKAHKFVEQTLRQSLLDIDIKVDETTTEMQAYANMYINSISNLCRDLKAWPEILIEEKVHIDWVSDELWGTADCVIYDELSDHMHVFDLKYGEGIMVEVEENPQLLFYATGCYYKFMPETITSWVIQPRANSGDTIKSWTYDAARIALFEDELKGAIEQVQLMEVRTHLGSEDVHPGDHCQFCPAHTVCPKHLETFGSLVEAKEHVVVDYDDTFSVHVMSMEKSLISWMKAIREGMEARALTGDIPDGTKLVRKNTHRQWIDEEKFKKKFGVRKTTVMKVMTPAQAEKEFGKEKVAKLICKPEGKPMLALTSDKRRAIEPPALTVFEDTTKE
jgi:hypothetical protein